MGMIVRTAPRLGVSMLSIAVVALVLSGPASAAAPDFVLRMPQGAELPGLSDEAGALNIPRGVVGNPDTGHVYISELSNARISEYTAWGLFVRSWGWDVAPEGSPGDTPADGLETCGPTVPEAEPSAGLCKEGDEGDGKGQLRWPMGLAIDPSDNVYVVDALNRRVQKFGPDGEFLLMFGGDVNKTKVEAGAPPAQRNICPADPPDICQAGTEGEGPSQLGTVAGDVIAYSPVINAIVVGDKGTIQVFDLDGTYREEISFEGALAPFDGQTVNGLDVDGDGNIYLSFRDLEDVYKLSAAGAPLSPGKPGESNFEAKNPLGVAVDVEDSVYAIDHPESVEPRVLKFSPGGEKLVPTAAEEVSGELFPSTPPNAELAAVATNLCAGSEQPGNLYVAVFNAGSPPRVSYVDTYGTAPAGCEPPPLEPPVLGEQFAASVGREDAVVRATIDPRFFADTTYYVEYGTGECSKGGCPNKAPVSPALLTKRSVGASIPTAAVVLEGLSPSTTYRYRFVAQSSGGGPVHGGDPDGDGPLAASTEHGQEAKLTTHAARVPAPSCPNDAFRIGARADLPDCRAYEMVSPLDKGNADVARGRGRNNVSYRFIEANKTALSAERFTFSSATAFSDPIGAPFSSQYLAEREEGGWVSEAISPPRTEPGVALDFNFGPEFQGFSDDLCLAWLRLFSVAPLVPEAVEKYTNLYRRDNCAEPPAYTALTREEPPTRPSDQYVNLLIKGHSADGSHTIFTAPDKLHPHAPTPEVGDGVLYERTPEELRFVCYLPSGKAVTEACSAGTPAANGFTDVSSQRNAISADGSRIFWTPYISGGATGSFPGRIYVRIGGKETVAVSVPVSADPAFFWTAADDGSKAIFSFTAGPRKGELYEFDVDAKDARLIAKGVEGPMGASEDASRIYFASSEDLDGAGPASAGGHNLYFYEADPGGGPGSFTFIMALTSDDVSLVTSAPNGPPARPVNLDPGLRAARVTPDGLHVTFASGASPTPTGYDNRALETGRAAAEVYRYDAAEGELRCVSCNPTGARPAAILAEAVMRAARIQGWEVNHLAPRVISDDGSRVFFESHEALVPEDANGTWDVYQWEEPGKGTCTTSRPTYTAATGGCVDLISSGQSASRSVFLDADPTGDSIFFGTQSSLVGTDYGLNDVYVARVEGGFPMPVVADRCEGEACQSPPPPPPNAPRGSEAFRGPGNVKRRPCAKGKRRVVRKGKARCVKRRPRPPKGARRKGGRR